MAQAKASKDLDSAVISNAENAITQLKSAQDAIKSVIFGQDTVIEHTLITLMASGHGLLIGVPGLAKTKLVETLGTVMGLDTRRIQFTPDLMPSDILGAEVLEESKSGARSFRFLKGPVFAQLVMADEINRASPRTQSALLQAMQEHHVTISGERHNLPEPFTVLATQNPIEQEGTYPLPEAQLDRFLLQIDITYPDREAEKTILLSTTRAEEKTAKTVLSGHELIKIQRLVRQIPIGESVVEAILDTVRAARPQGDKRLSWGAGPRAGQALMLACRARALLQGRFAPSKDDIADMLEPVLKHRMALTFAARAEGETLTSMIDALRAKL